MHFGGSLPVIVSPERVTSSAGPLDAAFDERLRLRQVILNVIPYNIDISRVIGMAQPIAEIDHLLPLDIRESGGFGEEAGSVSRYAFRTTGAECYQFAEPTVNKAYYSAVFDHPMETVWSLIRDFNNYPAYIDGVSESVIEDDKHGDEIGAVRRFCYLGNWIRQRLAFGPTALLTYAGIEPLPFPAGLLLEAQAPVRYEGTMHLLRVVEGDRTFMEWSVTLDTAPQDADRWRAVFQSWIPDWTNSLGSALTRVSSREH